MGSFSLCNGDKLMKYGTLCQTRFMLSETYRWMFAQWNSQYFLCTLAPLIKLKAKLFDTRIQKGKKIERIFFHTFYFILHINFFNSRYLNLPLLYDFKVIIAVTFVFSFDEKNGGSSISYNFPMLVLASIFKISLLFDASCLKEECTHSIFQPVFSYLQVFPRAKASIFYFLMNPMSF